MKRLTVLLFVVSLLLLLSACEFGGLFSPEEKEQWLTGAGDSYAGNITTNTIIEMWLFDENTGTTANGNKSLMDFTLSTSNQWTPGYNGTGVEVNLTLNGEVASSMVQEVDASSHNEYLICMRIAFTSPRACNDNTNAFYTVGNNNRFNLDGFPQDNRCYLRARMDLADHSSNNVNYDPYDPTVGVWWSFCLGFNTTHNVLYINGSFEGSNDFSGAHDNNTGEDTRLGEGPYNGGDITAIFDEVVVFNTSNQDVVDFYEAQCYRGTCGITPPVTNDPGIALSHLPQNTTYYNNTWFIANMSCVDPDNATLEAKYWVNNTLNTTNSSIANNTYWSFNVSAVYGHWNYNVTCYDGNTTVRNTTIYFTLEDDTFVAPGDLGDIVLNLTFDDATDCGNDSTGRHVDFDEQGSINCIDDRDICKWYGCLNATATSGDYLNSTTNYTVGDNFSVVFWIMPSQDISGGSSQAYYQIGEFGTENYSYSEEGDFGVNTKWKAATGEVGGVPGDSYTTTTSVWTHYVATYNGTNYVLYQNSVSIDADADAFGNLNYSGVGSDIDIARGVFGIDLVGYMDEFYIYNETLTQTNVTAIYDSQKAGTPPNLDLIVKNISITDALGVMYDFSAVNNTINLTGTIPLTYVIENTGDTNDSAEFNVTFYVGAATVCHNTTNLTAGETKTFICQINKTEGFITGNITVDSTLDINESSYSGGSDTNNDYLFHYDLRAHPKLLPAINISYVSNSSNSLAYGIYDTYNSGTSDDFDSGWTADNCDPRCKKGYENALICYLNGYDTGEDACRRARNHLEGWLVNVTDWADGSVQNVHELEWAAKTYDLMFNNLTEAEALLYSDGLLNACFDVYGKSNVRPDLDSDVVSAANGAGFGLGMAYPCVAVLGEVRTNPSSYYYPDDSTTGVSTPYNWLNRMDKHIMGTMNDSGLVEGVLYHLNYAVYHLVGLLYYDQQTQIFNVTQNRQGDICGKGRSAIYNYLDNTYNGETIRGDLDQAARFMSFGDSHSYDEIGETNIVGASVITQLGILCENQTVKDAMKFVRDKMYDDADSGSNAYAKPLEDIYHYETLDHNATAFTQSEMESTFYYEFENAWEKFWLRDGYDYENDTIIMLDGGDKPGFGHPNAEFDIFAYALGEPFLDQPQVPNEDDVRSERWHNTLSLSNSTATGYTADATDPPLNQPYGGASNPATSTYPDGTYMPDGYRGNVTDTFGLAGLIGGARAGQPYKGASPDPVRKILVYGDVMIDFFDVNRTSNGTIQFNWINIFDEFTPTINGTNLSFNRTGKDKNYRITVLNTSMPLTLEGGNSTYKASKEKEGAPDLDVWYGQYHHFVNHTDIRTIFLHHWWDGTDTQTTAKVTNGDDIGVKIGTDVYLIFDVNGNGTIYGDFSTDGWSLIINGTHVGSNDANYINNGTGNITLPFTPFNGMIEAAAAEAPAENDTCTFPAINENHEIDMDDRCYTTSDHDMGTGTLSCVDTGDGTDYWTLAATITVDNNKFLCLNESGHYIRYNDSNGYINMST